MKQEHSAGGVVCKKKDGGLWLIGLHSGYHKWVLPKGLIEKNETPKEAALREVGEETGIKAKIVKNDPIHIETYEYQADFSEGSISQGGIERRVMTYQESGGNQEWISKEVKFFLMEYVSGDVGDHSFEMEEVRWATYDEAIKTLEFEGEREALKKANQEILLT